MGNTARAVYIRVGRMKKPIIINGKEYFYEDEQEDVYTAAYEEGFRAGREEALIEMMKLLVNNIGKSIEQ